MKDNLQRAKHAFVYLLYIHIAALLVFFVFRWVLFVSMDYTFPEHIQNDWGLQAIAFVKGLWFDNVIACYILILPLVVLWITSLFNYTAKWIYLFTGGWFIGFYSLAFIISVSNIPYFEYFFKTINSSIYNWFGYAGTTTGMIFGETSYYFPIFLGITAIVLWGIGIHLLSKRTYERCLQSAKSISIKERGIILLAGAALVGLCLFGIRGRMGYNPIKVSQAYYCEDPFLNQLGVNPAFNLLTSTLDDQRKENRELALMDGETAINQVQNLLNRKGIADISPIARIVTSDTTTTHPNIVFIFMESMSAKLMQAYGQSQNLTPYLDSLYQESLVFNNIYSAGIHTNHGMYSTLYSFPTIMKRNAMKGSVIPVYSGLPTVLKDNGYYNLFFMTHESQYDNMNAFFRTNGFDEIYAEENYPKEKIANHFGVQDDYLYEYAIPILNERAQSGQPFFTVLLSISNHPPYVIPSYFHPKSDKIEDQIVEYADWSIRKFMTEAQKQPWFDNTLFVLIGDHGKLVGTPENEMPESYNHVPLMMYGKGITPQAINDFGGQIDVAPTLLGMLGINYTQNNFGVDLLKEKRPCIFYTADNLIAARDSSQLYIHSPETGQEFCYSLEGGTLKPSTYDKSFEALKAYVFPMLQATEQLVKEGKTINK
jgi:phosphoglycerol transferase MdoB-like AlkP superfamily enzyme